MKKVIFILSNINKALAFEWIADGLYRDLDIGFILLYPGQSELEIFLKERDIKVWPLYYSGKGDLIKSVLVIRKILKSEKPDVVHAHLLDAGLAGLMAAWLSGIKKRIYTRHHATSHHVYHPHAVRYDRWINYLSTHLVATSENVKQVLIGREHVSENKIHLIHHGFDLEAFLHPDIKKTEILKSKYNPHNRSPVIGVISRYIELKGIQYTIQAYKKLLEKHPDSLLILANASGKYASQIKQLLSGLPEHSYIEIVFENDLINLYHLFDIHVHVPVDAHSEAFGQTYIEALASGVPSVFTMSGVAPEIIRDRKNACVVPFRSHEAILDAIEELLLNRDLCKQITSQGKIDVKNLFGIATMISSLKKLYEN